MALVLARFVYGFALGWAILAIIGLGTLLCVRLIGLCLRLYAQPRHQDLASGVCVTVVVVMALGAMHYCGRLLYDFIGTSALVARPQAWLAGDAQISLVAVLGVAVSAALPAYASPLYARVRAWMARPPAQAKEPCAAPSQAAAPRRKESATPASPKRRRVPQLGWLALILLALGAALLAFAHGVAPLWPADNASPAALRQYQEYAARIRPVYVTALALLAGGGVSGLAWIFWRRDP